MSTKKSTKWQTSPGFSELSPFGDQITTKSSTFRLHNSPQSAILTYRVGRQSDSGLNRSKTSG